MKENELHTDSWIKVKNIQKKNWEKQNEEINFCWEK